MAELVVNEKVRHFRLGSVYLFIQCISYGFTIQMTLGYSGKLLGRKKGPNPQLICCFPHLVNRWRRRKYSYYVAYGVGAANTRGRYFSTFLEAFHAIDIMQWNASLMNPVTHIFDQSKLDASRRGAILTIHRLNERQKRVFIADTGYING